MHFQKKTILVFLSLYIFFSSSVFVSADEEVRSSLPVTLSAAQTLALYGQQISALYYNGATVSDVTFQFYGSSRTIVDSINNTFENPFVSGVEVENAFALDYAYTPSSHFPRFNVYQYYDSGFLSQMVSKEEIAPFEFLIYRAPFSPGTINEESFDFQINIEQSIDISGVDRFQTIYGYSYGRQISSYMVDDDKVSSSNLHSNLSIYGSASSVSPIVSLQDCVYRSSYPNHFALTAMPFSNMAENYDMNTKLETNQGNVDLYLFPAAKMALNIVDTGVQSEPITISHSVYNIRASQGVQLKEWDFQNETVGYSVPYVYLILMCPRIYGDYQIPDNKPSGSGSPDYTAPLNQIIQQLDNIANNFNFDTTNLETTITNTGNAIVNGIKNLFVPSQSDILTFRGQMIGLFNSKLGGLADVDNMQADIYDHLISASAMQSLDLPLMDLRPTVNFYIDKSVMENRGYSCITENGVDKVQVPLKPHSDKFGFFYEMVAAIIDVVCTTFFINTLFHKIKVIVCGERVVDIDDY